MTKRSIGGRHVAKERGLIPAWSGWPFGREVRNATAVLRNRNGRRMTKENGEPMKGRKPCQA
jgi:hypothetical protein